MRLRLRFAGRDHVLEAAWVEHGVQVSIGDRTVVVEVHRLDEHAFLVRRDGRRLSCAATGRGADRQLWVNGRTLRYELADTRRRATTAELELELVAPMPGVVRQVLVKAGDRVREGDKLVVLESMKMELTVQAAYDGVVEKVFCTEGQNVEGGEHLVAVARGDA